MWLERDAAICRLHPDVVAVYESRRGRLAVLLRHTMVPLAEERAEWREATRRASVAVIRALRAAGRRGPVIVLQWRPLAEAAHVLYGWACRYDGDPDRRVELTELVRVAVTERRHAALPADAIRGQATDGLAGGVEGPLVRWYEDMAPCWLGAEPPLRRRLILRTHRWIVERVLVPGSRGEPRSVDDVRREGRLVSMLLGAVPPAELPAWRPWIRLAATDLEHALAWPPSKRDGAWVRWLFLIPYAIPVGGPRLSTERLVPTNGER